MPCFCIETSSVSEQREDKWQGKQLILSLNCDVVCAGQVERYFRVTLWEGVVIVFRMSSHCGVKLTSTEIRWANWLLLKEKLARVMRLQYTLTKTLRIYILSWGFQFRINFDVLYSSILSVNSLLLIANLCRFSLIWNSIFFISFRRITSIKKI